MADLGATDVTVTLSPQDKDFLGVKRVSYPSIAFGGAGKTYGAANGIPMPAIGKFGMNKEIKRVFVTQPPGDGYVYKWDRANHKLRIYRASLDLLFIGGITATEPVAIDGGDTLGKNAATNRTVAGSAYATKGGVVPSPLVEVPATFVPAAITIELMMVGE